MELWLGDLERCRVHRSDRRSLRERRLRRKKPAESRLQPGLAAPQSIGPTVPPDRLIRSLVGLASPGFLGVASSCVRQFSSPSSLFLVSATAMLPRLPRALLYARENRSRAPSRLSIHPVSRSPLRLAKWSS